MKIEIKSLTFGRNVYCSIVKDRANYYKETCTKKNYVDEIKDLDQQLQFLCPWSFQIVFPQEHSACPNSQLFLFIFVSLLSHPWDFGERGAWRAEHIYTIRCFHIVPLSTLYFMRGNASISKGERLFNFKYESHTTAPETQHRMHEKRLICIPYVCVLIYYFWYQIYGFLFAPEQCSITYIFCYIIEAIEKQ